MRSFEFKKVELNITLKCNLACPDCNRLCNLMELEREMTPDEVALMVARLRAEGKKLIRTKVVGGEPTVHPKFLEICEVLSDGCKDGTVGAVTINTNGTLIDRFPNLPPGIRFKWSKPVVKKHIPVLWSPKDLGMESLGPCSMPKRCGFSLDAHGWLPCSVAIPITRLFGMMDLYMPLNGPLPTRTWGMDRLCQDCVFSTGIKGLHFVEMPKWWTQPSPVWARALWDWNRVERAGAVQ